MVRTQSVANHRKDKKAQRRRERKARRDKHSRNRKPTNSQHARKALDHFLGLSDIFDDYRFHGNIKWMAMDLARFALVFFWSEKKNVTDAFTETFRRAGQMDITATHTTYQGFMGALSNYVHVFIPVLILQLQRKIRDAGGRFQKVSGWVPIAFDGSRNSAARTQSNEQELCSAKGKRKAVKSPSSVTDPKPQAWITLMWHMGLRLPWNWRLGPSDSSERRHVQEMLSESVFPKNTLFVGDAGFVGYDFWRSIVSRGYDFMVRVGNNVKLIADSLDCRLDGDEVLCWPKDKQHKEPPLRLRLVRVTIGKADVYLLTSVHSAARLSSSSMKTLYKMRWGVEIEFRGLKQTLNGDKLRCCNADRLYTELHWSLLSMAVAELLAVTEQLANQKNGRTEYTPRDRSLANIMRAIYDCLDSLREVASPNEDLFSRLMRAVTDSYQRKRSKKARYRPRTAEKKKNKPKPPHVRSMTTDEQKKLKKIGSIVNA